MNLTYKSQLLALFYFAIATVFTGWFIASSPYPIGKEQFMWANLISFSRWGIQILAALLLLREERWTFIKNIGTVYIIGASLLLPFVILHHLKLSHDLNLFTGSQLLSILVMVILYHRAVQLSHLKLIWWLAWIACQIIAILLQVTVVFDAL